MNFNAPQINTNKFIIVIKISLWKFFNKSILKFFMSFLSLLK